MPSNFGITPCDPVVLLKALEAQLQQSGLPAGSNLPGAGLADRGFLSYYSDELHLENPVAERFATLRPVNFSVWQAVVDGSGPTQTGFNGIVAVTCFAQNSSDPEMKNTNAISEDAISTTVFLMRVCSALQFWTPRDGDANDLLREPGRIDNSGLRFFPTTGRGGPWTRITFNYEIHFTALLPSLAPGT